MPQEFDASKHSNTVSATIDPFSKEASLTLNIGEPSLYSLYVATFIKVGLTILIGYTACSIARRLINSKTKPNHSYRNISRQIKCRKEIRSIM